MDNFGRCREIESDYGRNKLRVTIADHNHSFVWLFQKARGDKIYLKCRRCLEIKRHTRCQGSVPIIHTSGDFVVDRDPRIGHLPNCEPVCNEAIFVEHCLKHGKK